MTRWLKLDLAAPMLAFGGVAIDHVGPTRDFPAISMLTGLFGNALGWHWHDRAAHQALQDRLVFAAALLAEGQLVTDTQNAKLEKSDRGWTTWGAPEGRAGDSYDAPHRRRRDYLCDAEVLVVCRLAAAPGPELDTDALAAALDRPARPLFLGRKPCLPARRLFAGWVDGETAHAALAAALTHPARAVAQEEGPGGDRGQELADLRNWRSGLHGGSRPVVEGRILPGGAMTLHLIRLGLRPVTLAEWAARRGQMQASGFDEGRALHHLLGETFGPGALQPFRLLTAPGGQDANLYGYSAAGPEALRETAEAIALPDALAVLPLAGVEAKPMPASWRRGQRLGFDIRVRPVVRLAKPVPAHVDLHDRPQPERRAGAETDAFLARVLRAGGAMTREAVYVDWLADRLAPAARLDGARLTRFERSRAARSGVTEGPDATLQGTLEIADPEAFAALLARGIGRHRAYGYGMLLLRAPGRPAPER